MHGKVKALDSRLSGNDERKRKPISTRLGDVVNFKRGYDLPESIRCPGPYPVISSAGISGYHNEYKARGEGVITGRYGTLGEMHYYNGEYWPHNTALYVTDFKGNIPKYVYYLLTSLGHLNTGDKSAVPGVNRNDLHELAIPLISDHGVQQKIAFVLSMLDAKIDLNDRINAELEALAKTLYDYWFVQFDFPDAKGRPYKTSGGRMVWNEALRREIPAGWDALPLSSLVAVSTASLNPEEEPDRIFRHLSIPSFDSSGSFIMEPGRSIGSSKFSICKSDLLVSKLNPWFNRVVADTDYGDLICSTEFVVWRCGDANRQAYLNQVATHPRFIGHCTQSATGTSNSHKRVNPQVMMRHLLPHAQAVAEKFGQMARPLLDQQLSNARENRELTQLRDWLLPLLMNGQVRVG